MGKRVITMTKNIFGKTRGILAVFLIVGMSSIPQAAALDKHVPGAERIAKAIEVLKDMIDPADEGLPPSLLGRCRGLAIIPGVIKAAYGIGGQYGRGLLVVRNEDGSWSAPVFISMIGGSLGWQLGVQKSDIILVFKTEKSVDGISSGKVTLGADMSVAAGPVGRNAEAATDLDMEAEIYSYSKSKGLFAGISLKGASIQIDKDANREFYGRPDIEAKDILTGKSIEPPPSVLDLKKALENPKIRPR
jgi:lipid-binding SYLF domain-containing protein